MSTSPARRPTAGGGRPTHATWTLAALGAAAALVLGGCSMAGGEPESPDTSASDAASEAAQERDAEQLGEAAETLSSGSPSAEPTPIEDLPVVATRTASADGQPIEVDLNGVNVEGDVMSAVFTVRNVGQGRIQLSQSFDDGVSNVLPDGGSSTDNAFTADGVYVLDGVNAKRHLVARDSSGRCVCSGNFSSTFVSAGQQVVLSATFTAVPDDVETVSVVVPLAGEFAGVPVTR